jgi:hypothetical protein
MAELPNHATEDNHCYYCENYGSYMHTNSTQEIDYAFVSGNESCLLSLAQLRP